MSSYSQSRAKARSRMQNAARDIESLKEKIAQLRAEKMSEKEMKAFSLHKIFEKTSSGNRSIGSKKVRNFERTVAIVSNADVGRVDRAQHIDAVEG